MKPIDFLDLGGFRRTPYIQQFEASECGLACLAMVAGRHGLDTDLTTLRRKFSLSLKGTTLKTLIQIAEQIGFHARPLRGEIDEDFTAKHFRTWSASAIAFERLCGAGEEGIGLKAMLEPVADALGNTPAISRKSYVHPALIDAVKHGRGFGLQCPRPTKYLSSVERGLIAFLGKAGRRRARTKTE